MRFCLLALILCFAAASASTQSTPDPPLYDGYVTASAPQGIDVDGAHLRFTSDSLSGIFVGHKLVQSHSVPVTFLGQPAKVFGTFSKRTSTVTVKSLILGSPTEVPVSGLGIIDLLPEKPASLGRARHIRADGRLLTLTSDSALTFAPPLTPATPLRTNLWIRYRGVQQVDGTVTLVAGELSENIVNPSEDHLRQKAEYDPAAVDPESHQNPESRFFRGVDPKQLPPWPDQAMQARVDRIGQKLIPTYQRDLPEADATKIHFRFAVVDELSWKDALTLPNGIIAVPYQVVERLENDSQLATILADNIAEAIEKQSFRLIPAQHRMTAVEIAGAAGGLFVPGLGAATSITNSSVATHLLTLAEQQSGRVSLYYLHDAGFDLTEAPKAWWRLQAKPGKPLAQVPIPPRARNLFIELGTTWRNAVQQPPANQTGAIAGP